MANIAKQLTELVGNTPLLELNKYSQAKGLETPVIAKVEFFNPGGSVKDRIALAMIEDAEAKGILKPGATIIDMVETAENVWSDSCVCAMTAHDLQ